MTPLQRARARDLFQRLLDLPESDQARELETECPDDDEVRAQVLRMLREDRAAGGADFEPLVSPVDASRLAAAIAESPGMTIGPYRIVRVLGEGGFGTVFLAEQSTPIRREVALKVVKLGMDTREVIARFHRERQAMALLDHPNIAKVYDAGSTDSGRPYFSMEVCPGEPITKYCDAGRLTIEQRLAIFCTVCRAVHHAHQRGLIHRDLKPSNILVSRVDGKPAPKVIDFGIAKAIRQDLRAGTMVSVQQQFIGTPEYTSPEQAQGESDVDTRSDVYSLGVLLYELLTGETPVPSGSLRRKSGESLQKAILEAEVIAPSVRLRTGTDRGTRASTLRATEPARLRTQLRRDLDWVVLRAIEKDRERRYGSVAELEQDLERYLRGEAVLAAPPSTWYALRKSARRHRPVVAAAALVLATLLLGIAGTLSQAREARREAAAARAAEAAQTRLARAEAERSKELQQVAEFQAEMLRSLDAFTMGNNLASDMRARLIKALEVDRMAEAERSSLLAAFDAALLRINTTDVASDLLDREILQPSVRAIDESFVDQPRARGLLQANVASSFAALSMRANALLAYRRAVGSLSEGLGPDNPKVLAVQLDELMMLNAMDDLEAMQVRARDLLARAQRVLEESDPLRLSIEREWAATLRKLGRLQESLEFHKAVLAKCRRLLPASSDVTNKSIAKTANVLADLAQYDEAESLLREAIKSSVESFGPTHENTLPIKLAMAFVQSRSGKYEESLALLDELIEARTTARGTQNLRTVNPLLMRTGVLVHLGRLEEAEADCRKVIAAIGSRPMVDTIRAIVGARLAQILSKRHDYAAAEDVLEKQIQLCSPQRSEPLLHELEAVYAGWAEHEPSADLAAKREALLARLAERKPASGQGQ
ncbi:MAG: serine/threonine protein kinase [Planctomycetes bacterium]|nr:serine/threonine protein kinase [Planctomycetota bacterium]